MKLILYLNLNSFDKKSLNRQKKSKYNSGINKYSRMFLIKIISFLLNVMFKPIKKAINHFKSLIIN